MGPLRILAVVLLVAAAVRPEQKAVRSGPRSGGKDAVHKAVDDSHGHGLSGGDEHKGHSNKEHKAPDHVGGGGLPSLPADSAEFSLAQLPPSEVSMLNEKAEGQLGHASFVKVENTPLRERLEDVEMEVSVMQRRIAYLQTEVTGTTDVDEKQGEQRTFSENHDDGAFPDHRPRAAALQQVFSEVSPKASVSTAVTSRVASVESEVASLKPKLMALESQVTGRSVDAKIALNEGQAAGSSLKSRIVYLEEELESMGARVSTLEHTWAG